jgi:feruloyl esterase
MVGTIVRRLAMAAVIFCAALPTDAATSCDALTSLGLANGRVSSTHLIAAAAFVPPAGPAAGAVQALYARLPGFCRALLTLTPSNDSDIKVEVWLPAGGWNGKFQAVGNGGFAGVLPYPAMARALVEGYATAGTDTGHVGNSADFVPGHPEKLVDFAYRAVHEMTVAAKHIVDAHYGRAPQFSYFNGCSQGGRQAITSAQRYPADFDGIVAGAPAWDTMRSHAARLALNFTVNRSPDAVIPPAKYPVIHDAVLKACDALDGVTDGVIEDPTSCTVDFAALECKEADGPACLTAPQIASAKAITTPLVHHGTGEVIFPGHLMPGAELEWAVLGGPRPLTLAQSGVANIVFGDRTWTDRSFNVAAHLDRIDSADRGLLKSNDPNLAPFFARGGKLLMYHGWADQQVPPQLSPLYFSNVLRAVGPSAEQSIALFMMPGVYHCAGGPGPDNFDRMGVIEAWVEKGQKPARILAWHQTAGKTDRTRPLCAIGQVAAYQGTGSTDDAANFACVAAGPARSSTARR